MTDEVTRDSILANLRAGRDEIAAIEDDGTYVLMTAATGICFRDGAAMGCGLQWATRYTRRQITVTGYPDVTNGKGEKFAPIRIAAAKVAAIADLDKAIAGFESIPA